MQIFGRSKNQVNEHDLAVFLMEHPEWYPALYISNDADPGRVLCFGVFGPSEHFFNFSAIKRFLATPSKCQTK